MIYHIFRLHFRGVVAMTINDPSIMGLQVVGDHVAILDVGGWIPQEIQGFTYARVPHRVPPVKKETSRYRPLRSAKPARKALT